MRPGRSRGWGAGRNVASWGMSPLSLAGSGTDERSSGTGSYTGTPSWLEA